MCIRDRYNDLLKSHDFIISIHISDKLSATHSTALQAMNQLSNEKIRVIDSKNGTLGLGSLVHKVALINESDKDFESLINKTQDLVEKAEFFGLVPTLEYLAKGGRIGKAQEFFGSLLKVKPILSAVDGEIHPVGKVRTLNKGMDYIVDIVKENKITVFGEGERKTNFIEIRDLCKVIEYFLTSSNEGTYNVGKENISLLELATRLIKSKGNKDSSVNLVKEGKREKFILDTSKLRKLIEI